MMRIIVPFQKDFERKEFDCGIPALNLYIKTQASQDMRNYYAVIFTAMEEGGKKIMGYGYFLD